MTDIVERLRDYQRWMKDGKDRFGAPCPSICVDDIDGDETFGAAADEIKRLDREAAFLGHIVGQYDEKLARLLGADHKEFADKVRADFSIKGIE